MEQNSAQLSPKKLKKFIKHLCLATRKVEERLEAHDNLDKHIASLKRMASRKSRNVSKGFMELRDRIDDLIEKEKQAINIRHHEPLHNVKLKDRLQQLDDKFKTYRDFHVKRQKRIQDLERKITGKTTKKEVIKEVKEKIEKLRNRYNRLIDRCSEEDLEKIKNKIELLKSKLEKL